MLRYKDILLETKRNSYKNFVIFGEIDSNGKIRYYLYDKKNYKKRDVFHEISFDIQNVLINYLKNNKEKLYKETKVIEDEDGEFLVYGKDSRVSESSYVYLKYEDYGSGKYEDDDVKIRISSHVSYAADFYIIFHDDYYKKPDILIEKEIKYDEALNEEYIEYYWIDYDNLIKVIETIGNKAIKKLLKKLKT